MELFNGLVSWLMKRRIGQIERFMQSPHEVQHEVFRYLIKTASSTVWGRKYGYRDPLTPAEFAQRVPVSSYEQIFPYIERIMKGEQNLLWPGEIQCFSKSSGTTNARSKFIPVSDEALEDCHYKAGKDMLCLYVNNYPDTRLFTGKNLGIGGSMQPNPMHPGSYIGDVSALIMKFLPTWAEYMRTPGLDIALMDRWEEKIARIASVTIKENVTCMAGVPTWTVVLLERILELSGKQSIKEVWPNLEVFFHGAVSFTPYRSLFGKLIQSEQMRYMETYNASEGFFGLQDDRHRDDMLLLLDYGVYYEFIPAGHFDEEYPPTLTLDQVEPGKNYAMVISTNGGLWRYKIGDTVRFTSTKPYRIKITGRTRNFINAFGEEVIVENADIAIAEACKATHAVMLDYTAAPVYLDAGSKGGHEWIIEFEREPDSMELFTQVLDQTLRGINSDYDAKRYMDIALQMPRVHAIPKGTFYEWMASRNKLGGQHKVPRLSNSREYVEEIMGSLSLQG